MLFPIRDDQPTVRVPHVTIALIGINSVIFILSQALGPRGFAHFLMQFGFTPALFMDPQAAPPDMTWLYLTPVTSMFLHGGWMHLIGNMVFLWIFGNNIEDYFGHVRFVLFYLISGLAAIAMYTLFNPDSTVPLVGASGAIAGVMGAYMVLHPRARVTCLLFFFFITFVDLPAKLVLGIWFFYQLLMSMAGSATGGGVAYMAHVGGFIFGWALLKLLVKIRGRGMMGGDGPQTYRITW
ncbi:MAG: rhomboid family intramembrane serine protease [Candidatus Zixiibacteriota bacterium]|nr:MAG: rhomboid family intramembrane serine protease [candidate division Zixibacteria bacterium]